MKINYNVSAMISNNALANNDDLLSKSLERLSSGLKINKAKDNPAGLAMAKRMNAQLEGLSKANQNAGDGISVIETVDGALSEVHSMLQRINELAVKAKTATMSDGDRELVQQEISELCDEIDRVSDTIEFNSQKLMNGEFDLRAYTDVEDVTVSYYSDEVATKVYTITSATIGYDAETREINSFVPTFGGNFPAGVIVKEIKDNEVTLAGSLGFEMRLDLNEVAKKDVKQIGPLNIDVTGIGAMRLQIGSNEGQVLEVRIPKVKLKNMGIEGIDVSTIDGAADALSRMSNAIGYVSSVRSRLGAYQNRLESTISTLDITSENMTAAYSRIMDVDMAEEMTKYTTYQILTQAGTSMLAQANERPSQALQLLQ